MTLRAAANTSMRTWRRYFPLYSVDSVVTLFEEMLQTSHSMETTFSASTNLEPNLAFASIILGYIESHITRDPSTAPQSSDQPFSSGISSTRKRPSSSNLKALRAAKRMTIRGSSPAPSPVELPSPDAISMVQDDDARSTVSMPPSELAASPMSVTTEPPKPVFPVMKFEDAEQLYHQFYEMIIHDPKVIYISINTFNVQRPCS